MTTNQDRRRFQRVETSAELQVGKISYPEVVADTVSARGRNLGQGGACFLARKSFSVRDLVAVRLSLPGWQRYRRGYAVTIDDERAMAPLTAIAEVAWTKQDPGGHTQVGVRFRNIHQDDFDAFLRYLQGLR